jgi:hypothetical protein
MKKIFSPIIILSMILTLFSFGCNRLAIYKQHESNNPGYLMSYLFINAASGNCAIAIKTGAATFNATANQLPSLVCRHSEKYYIGAADEATTFAAATQMLADIAARNAPVSAIFTAVVASGSTVCNATLSQLTTITPNLNPLPGSTFANGNALWTAAGQNLTNYLSPCLQVGTSFGLDQWLYCLSDAGQQAVKAGREAAIHYQVISDVKADTAFANNLAAQKLSVAAGGFNAASFTAAQLANTGTVDRNFASVMLQTPEGSAFNIVLTVIASNPGAVATYAPCAKWIIDPAPAGNYANVRAQVARLGSTSLNGLLGINMPEFAAVTTPVTYDILLQPAPAGGLAPYNGSTGTSRAGIGLLCGTGGAFSSSYTSQYGAAYGSVFGACDAGGTSLLTW